jgi:hypothetical protein
MRSTSSSTRAGPTPRPPRVGRHGDMGQHGVLAGERRSRGGVDASGQTPQSRRVATSPLPQEACSRSWSPRQGCTPGNSESQTVAPHDVAVVGTVIDGAHQEPRRRAVAVGHQRHGMRTGDERCEVHPHEPPTQLGEQTVAEALLVKVGREHQIGRAHLPDTDDRAAQNVC